MRNYEQFLLLLQCFQKLYAVEVSESDCMWEREKGEIAHFELLNHIPQCFINCLLHDCLIYIVIEKLPVSHINKSAADHLENIWLKIW